MTTKTLLLLMLLLGLIQVLLPPVAAATEGCTGKPKISNGRVRCSRFSGCKAKCYRGYKFPTGDDRVTFKCVDGEYEPDTGEQDYDQFMTCNAVCSDPCGNGGTCTRPGHCECPEGWGGETCNEAHCDEYCGNGQVCIAPNKCGCPKGKTGPKCDKVVHDNPGDEMLAAVRSGDLDTVKTFMQSVDVNYVGGEDANSGLHECAIHNSTAIAEFLLNNGAQVDLLNKPGHTALLVSAKYNTAEVAKTLLQYGAALELKNNWGNTPLLKAVFYDSVDVVKVLLSVNASLTATERHGKTPLDVARERNFHEVRRLLIGRGFDLIGAVRKGDMEEVRRTLKYVNIDYAGPPQANTALHEAVLINNVDIAGILLQNNATVGLRNREGSNALNLAMDKNFEVLVALLEEYHLMDAVREDHVNDVRLFLINVDINYALPDSGNTALHVAALHNRPISTRMLLDHNPNIYKVNNKGHTPFKTAVLVDAKDVIHILLMARSEDTDDHFAMESDVKELLSGIRNGQLEVVTTVIDKIGLNTAMEPDGNTALHLAAIYGQIEIATFLLDSKANVDAQDNYGNSPLHDAAIHDRPDMAKLLLAKNAQKDLTNIWNENPLMTCAWANSPHVLKVFMDNDANPSMTNDKGQTPRGVAMKQEHYEIVRLLDGNGEDLIGAVRLGLLDEVQFSIPLVDINYAGPPDGNTALHEAAIYNQAELAELLLDNGALTDIVNKDGNTALHLAAIYDVSEIIRSLIKHNANIDIQNKMGKPAVQLAKDVRHWTVMRIIQGEGYDLIGAVREGNIEKVREMISKVDLNYQGQPDDQTAVHEAVVHNQPEILALLMENGADVEIWNKIGNSVLHKAAIHNQVEMAKVLISHGASATLLNDRGNAPAHEAAIENNAEMITYLIEHGAPIDEFNYNKDTPLLKAVRFKSTEVVRILLDHNASISIRDVHFQTPFDLAQWKKSPKIIEMLAECHMMQAIEEGNVFDVQKYLEFINVNFTMKPEGLAPLHKAAIHNRPKIAEMLIRNWANVDIENIHGSTPLHDAAVHNSGDTAKILLYYNASANIANEWGNTALETAMEFNANDVVLALMLDQKKYKDDNEVEDVNKDLLWAVRTGDIAEVNKYLSSVDINYSGPPDDNTGLHEAAVHDQLEIAELLIRKGIDINGLNKWGMTPLFYAAIHDSQRVTKVLIQQGADLNIVENKWGNSPLMTAAWSNATNVFLILMDAGADMDIQDVDGLGALQLAEVRGHHKIVRLINGGGKDLIGEIRDQNTRAVEKILEDDVDVNYAGPPEGNTGLHEAAALDQVEILQLLIQKGATIDALNNEESTALHVAAMKNNINAAKVLIENGASVQVKNKLGKTPLLAAVKHVAPDVVELLLHYNSSITHWYMDGQTPLALAKSVGSQEIINMLADYVEPPVLNVGEEVILLTDISPDPIYGDITMVLECKGKENVTWRYPSIQNYRLTVDYSFNPELDWPYKSTFKKDKAIPEYTGFYTCSYQDVPNHNDTTFVYVHRDLKLHTQGVVVARDLDYINPNERKPKEEPLIIYCLPTLPDLKVRLYKFNKGLWTDVTSQWMWNNKLGFTKINHDHSDRDVYECRAQGYTYHASINIR